MTDMDRTVLVDCDGVLSDFVGRFQEVAAEEGIVVPPTTDYDLLAALSEADRQRMVARLTGPGFAAGMKAREGARSFVAGLCALGLRVVVVTSPWSGCYWLAERERWLLDVCGIETADIVQTSKKDHAPGLTLIDDSPQHCQAWAEAHGRPAILMSAPHNETALSPIWGWTRALFFGDALARTKVLFSLANGSILSSGVQPDPAPNALPAVWDLVVADMRARDAAGQARYGVRLQAHNGRDALRDAYEEALDLAVYLRQAIYERDGG